MSDMNDRRSYNSRLAGLHRRDERPGGAIFLGLRDFMSEMNDRWSYISRLTGLHERDERPVELYF